MNTDAVVKEAKEWNDKGKSLRVLNKYQEAIACYDRAIELQPAYARAWFNKGNALRDSGKPEEALICYSRAIALEGGKNAVTWYAKGEVLESLRKHPEAILCYDQAIAVNPAYTDAWNNKGAALFLSGEYVDALVCFEKAIEIEPKYIPAWNNKGRALHELGRYEESVACCDRVLEIDPKRIYAWCNKKIALKALGKMAGTMPRKYQETLRRIALETLELKHLGEAFRSPVSGSSDEASKEEEGGSSVSPYTEFGWECMEDGKYDKAAAAFKNSVQIDKDYSGYLDLSLAYRRMRKPKEALRYCEKAAEFIMRFACRFVAEGDECARLPQEARDRLPWLLDAAYSSLLHDPNYATLCGNQGYILLALGRDIEARRMFLEAKVCEEFMDFLPDEDEESE